MDLKFTQNKFRLTAIILCNVSILYWIYSVLSTREMYPIETISSSENIEYWERNWTNQVTDNKCDAECKRFESYMSYDWPADKPRAAIYISTNQLTNLIKILKNSEKSFNYVTKYPYIIFHEEDFTKHKGEIGRQFLPHSRIFYQIVKFNTLPKHISKTEYKQISTQHCNNKPLGYRYMCYFHSKLVYTYPIMDQVDYALRLDDDSEFLKPITFDMFRYMRDNDLHYGYLMTLHDLPDCVHGLWELVRDYINTNGIKPTFYHSWYKPDIFYNNFEISKTSIWRSPEYKAYIEFIDQSKGIFLRRWGDAPVKTLGLSLFTPWNRIHRFTNIRYRHQGSIT